MTDCAPAPSQTSAMPDNKMPQAAGTSGPPSPHDLDAVWAQFRASGDSRSRQILIDHYAYLVKITAGRLVRSLPVSLEQEDVLSAGYIGLIRSVDQFDWGRGVKFETYAIALVRGAVLDCLRSEDWMPRQIRDRIRKVTRSTAELEAKLGRGPTDDELCTELGISVDELYSLNQESSRAIVSSLDEQTYSADEDDGIPLLDRLPGTLGDPSREMEIAEVRSKLAEAIDRLSPRLKRVTALYYYEGMTFKEIAEILEVSESRVYQLCRQSIKQLRSSLYRDRELFSEGSAAV
ncbi:MAG: FliA/WhiG family RNA polymerase sigma factor [Chloroflexi bacterium]|nr:FliA/WhiG family RNA polymerase sigma factor [Chloroflexota bacterium]